MTNQQDTDFQAVYEGKEKAQGVPWVPWNIDEPQPALAALERGGYYRSEILDAGCGVGDTVIFLAEKGYTAVGIDFAPTAIEEARRRSEQRGVSAAFEVGELTGLQEHEGRFTTVVDSGTLPAIATDQKLEYLKNLAMATTSDAKYVLLTFSDKARDLMPVGPTLYSEDELRSLLDQSPWTIETIKPAAIAAKLNPDLADKALGVDDKGRVLVPALLVIAQK
ncbi:class I SAM-dependent methyltransferase [Dietzia timorensis]|uniref:class I SAM-dependent methyltransferase n=1 Tax=Dietzia timorensis TaxID=499555 RepID=UPI000832F7FC|nr:class I SAM-dependent methyltransferase [Dietzia timorensis]